MNLQKKFLSDPVIKWVFNAANELNVEGYLIGGYVRDIIRGKRSNDRDFVFKDNVEYIAKKTAQKFNATFVVLKAGRTYRIVLKDKAILDFSGFISSIDKDLEERDFTINAIAWSPQRGIIDPFNGIKDIRNHYIRAVKMENLLQDPLRIIRAYRFAAELGFRIDNNTRKALALYSKYIHNVAHERITEEFFKLLNNSNAIKWIKECDKDVVLKEILYTNGLHKNLRLLSEFDGFIKKQLLTLKEKYLKEEINQGLQRLGLLRLFILLGDHMILNTRLRVSRKINNALKVFNKVKKIIKNKRLDTAMIYEIFTVSGEWIKEISFCLSFLKRKDIGFLVKMADRYLKIEKDALLNGHDIQKILGIWQGEKIGDILSSLKKMQFDGSLKTRSQAIDWCLRNFT